MNESKIILDLCGGTGAWSQPYKDAGYDVRLITLPENDVRTYEPPDNVYGILAAPPCTMFTWTRTRAVKPRDLREAMECVRACLNIIWGQMEIVQHTKYKKINGGQLKFWAMENPTFGFLPNFLGKPAFTFDPWEFGDGYQKRTGIWGYFNEPIKCPVPMSDEVKAHIKGNRVLNLKKFDQLRTHEIHPDKLGTLSRQARRAITPAGFAKAFFEANK